MIVILHKNFTRKNWFIIRGKDVIAQLKEHGIEYDDIEHIPGYKSQNEYFRIKITDDESKTMLKLISESDLT